MIELIEEQSADGCVLTACGRCDHYRRTGNGVDQCGAGGKFVLCKTKNTDGHCPDFIPPQPKFDYFTGVWRK